MTVKRTVDQSAACFHDRHESYSYATTCWPENELPVRPDGSGEWRLIHQRATTRQGERAGAWGGRQVVSLSFVLGTWERITFTTDETKKARP